jgi:hypothetical protein
MDDDGIGKFVVGDLVTAQDYKIGRVIAATFQSAIALNKIIGKVRLAGESMPRWFYRVRGGGFDDAEWLREESLAFPTEY